tara:strand:+ start:1799 stop:2617 length:819 start_codon:yes stop_codon:yes gene_type:complete
MFETASLWIVTDVDGTLMDHSYDLSPAKDTIRWLSELRIPVILCTSKTSSEVKVIRKELGINHPYIVENGAAIYGETKEGKPWEIILGEKYEILEEILVSLSKDINHNLVPLNKLNDIEAYDLTGLSGNALTLMRDRHWSMPFLSPPEKFEEKLNYYCKRYQVNIFRGNRMSHLLSINSNKGKAIKKLTEFSKIKTVKIIGLGDSPNDFPLLINSDYKIVISGISGPNQKLLDSLDGEKIIISKMPNGFGWKDEVIKVVKRIYDTKKKFINE